nr:MAG TPA: hypothetical protein [Caudoviricetes sp.]
MGHPIRLFLILPFISPHSFKKYNVSFSVISELSLTTTVGVAEANLFKFISSSMVNETSPSS